MPEEIAQSNVALRQVDLEEGQAALVCTDTQYVPIRERKAGEPPRRVICPIGASLLVGTRGELEAYIGQNRLTCGSSLRPRPQP